MRLAIMTLYPDSIPGENLHALPPRNGVPFCLSKVADVRDQDNKQQDGESGDSEEEGRYQNLAPELLGFREYCACHTDYGTPKSGAGSRALEAGCTCFRETGQGTADSA